MDTLTRSRITRTLTALLLSAPVCSGQVFPGATWEFRTPAETGLDAVKLDEARDYIGGRGCVVRHGYMVYTWGDQSLRQDIASACKPWFSHFLFKALEDGRLSSLDEPVVNWESCLGGLNAALDHKDRGITFRHMANQISCYGVREAPGTAFDYNDWQMALFWDTLFLKVYGATYANVDATVLHPMLTEVLQCEDNPTLLAFGAGDRAGRMRISVRDFARFGLLYLRHGNWKGQQLISPAHAVMAVSSPLPNSIPRTGGQGAEMCAGQRSIGSNTVPDNQTDHNGSYSWLWWTNGLDRSGQRHYPGSPLDTYAALGHGGARAVVVVPSLDLVFSWNDTALQSKPGNPGEAIRRVVGAVLPDAPRILLSTTAVQRTVECGANLSDESFTVSNGGIGELAYRIEPDQAWLSASPSTGSSTGEPDIITIHYELSNTAIGTHVANITVRDNGSSPPADNSPQTLTVIISVASVLPDLDRDGDVDQEDFGRFQACYSPNGEMLIPALCVPANFNRDELIDQQDFSVLWGCMSGSGVVASRNCDDLYQ